MIVGFTGSRHGMTDPQKKAVAVLLKGATRFHHGDCIGADSEAHDIAVKAKAKVYIHPPTDPSRRAFRPGHRLAEKPYLVRNRDIVDFCDVLIATPNADTEQETGGTWFTIRHARDTGTDHVIVWPDGTVERHLANDQEND